MTAELVFRELKEGRLHLDDTFHVSEHAWRTGGAHAHATASFLDVNSNVRIEDLLRGLIVQSGNDAAIVLAEGMAGSEEAFADRMNKRAAELGLAHSNFVDPWGQRRPGAEDHRARHGAARRPHHPRISRLLPLLRREGVHLEQDPPVEPQSAARRSSPAPTA